ncbi:MAG: hypothetical protein HUU04_03450 [Verrucomicrobiae bacterium]|nr:hypothetical protein [Verrucomicrobiae bacterium]
MNALLLQGQSQAYTLLEELQEPPEVSAVRRAEPDEIAREELLLRKLGPKGWGRVHHFRNYYASGWGENGHALSPKALDAFFRFVEVVEFPADKASPSVFLTDRGGIELCWENRAGESVQVEFTASGVECYQAASDREGLAAFEDLEQLSRQLSS